MVGETMSGINPLWLRWTGKAEWSLVDKRYFLGQVVEESWVHQSWIRKGISSTASVLSHQAEGRRREDSIKAGELRGAIAPIEDRGWWWWSDNNEGRLKGREARAWVVNHHSEPLKSRMGMDEWWGIFLYSLTRRGIPENRSGLLVSTVQLAGLTLWKQQLGSIKNIFSKKFKS